jgi:hypothetical protein
MKGEVVGVNGDRCAVRIPSGITLIKVLSEHSIETGDIVSGNLDALGPEPLLNETRNQRIKAFITGWGCSQKKADNFLNP